MKLPQLGVATHHIKLTIASVNLGGAQEPRQWLKFLKRMERLAREAGVDVVLGQEHNLHPSREGEVTRLAREKGFALVIAFAPPDARGVHGGGTFVLAPSPCAPSCISLIQSYQSLKSLIWFVLGSMRSDSIVISVTEYRYCFVLWFILTLNL